MADDNLGQEVMDQIRKPYRSIYERVTHFFDPATNAATNVDKSWQADPADVKKATDTFKQPEDATPAKTPDTKPLSQRTLGGKKRPPIKKPTDTQQTQRKQP